MRTLLIVMTAALASVSCASVPWPAQAATCEPPTIGGNERPALLRKPLEGDGARLTTGFGVRLDPLQGQRRLHTGIDWAAGLGTPVVSSGPGRVVSVTFAGELGQIIIIDHGAGWHTLYGHLSNAVVAAGDCVTKGTPIGSVGVTGLASGPTLHFEVQREGRPIDPLSLSAW